MIISRPQSGNILSFILFFVVAYAVLLANIATIAYDPHPQWLNYLIVAVVGPIALFITYKVVFRYKVIRMGHERIEVAYPQFRIRKSYALTDVSQWTETVIKTGKTSSFKELEIKFADNRKITMGHREYRDYEKMVNYLERKLSRMRK